MVGLLLGIDSDVLISVAKGSDNETLAYEFFNCYNYYYRGKHLSRHFGRYILRLIDITALGAGSFRKQFLLQSCLHS